MMKRCFEISVGAIALAVALGSSASATAQTDQGAVDESSGGIQAIVVTAQKREQKLNDVGITISAVSGQQLQAAGVTDASRLAAVVPGFNASTSVFGTPVFSLRGVNFNSFQASAPPTVSTYLDEAALPYPVMGQALFLDVERVEVLKGPQGTLFGQNATGGSINVIAAKPTSTFSAGFHTDVNHWGQVDLEGFISGPISDTLRARLSAQTTQFGGWQRGYFLNDQKNGDQNKGAARLLLDWTPTDRLKIALNVNGSYDRSEVQQGQAFIITPANPAAASPVLLSYATHLPNDARDLDFDRGFDTRADSRNFQAVLRADYEFTDELTFTSLTNYVDTRFRRPGDQDGTAFNNQQVLTAADIESINQEVRISGNYPDAGLNFVIGGSYGHDKINETLNNNYAGYTGFPPGSAAYWSYDLTQRAAAVFGSVDYEIVPGLTLTAGARYTDTKQSIKGCTFDAGPGGVAGIAAFLATLVNPAVDTSAYQPGGCITIDDNGPNPTALPIFADKSQKEDNVAWRGAVSYKVTDDSLIYASVSRGYKAGVYNVIISLFDSGVAPVTQEELTAYEVGAKLTLLDRRLQFNVAGFYYDYKDKQFFSFKPVASNLLTAALVNIPKSKVKGIDADITAEPIEGLTLRASGTYLETEVSNFMGFDFTGQNVVDYSGKEFNYASPWSANLDAQYKFPVGDGLNAVLGSSLTYRSRTFADLGEVPAFRLPAYTLVDARIGIESEKGWSASIWGRNLTDEYYWTSAASFGDGAIRFTGPPRTFGASFTFRY